MAAKSILVICALALLLQTVLSYQASANTVVDNNISFGNILSSGSSSSGLSGYSSGFGSASSGSSAFGSGISGLSGISGSSSASAASINSQTGLNVVSGGPLIVTSVSPIGPSGLAVASENAIEGVLTVSGQLPFLSAVAFEGGLPTSGSGVATCGCGNGEVGITSEGLSGSSAANNAGRIGRRF